MYSSQVLRHSCVQTAIVSAARLNLPNDESVIAWTKIERAITRMCDYVMKADVNVNLRSSPSSFSVKSL
jgi:hypothetical protein